MGKFSNGESAGGPLRANSGCWPFCSPLLRVLGKPVIFSAGRNEPSGGYLEQGPPNMAIASVPIRSASLRDWCRSEQRRLPEIGRRPDPSAATTRRTYGDQREARKPRQSPPIGQHWTRNRSPTLHY